ncbi:nitroreductase family deazaflavin-dependent oxidoreductase [Streptomyces sp. NPDC001985]|uniref:nitroreductase family deazaflavin-dependent oxidoreductase n=1 Tax=Streptomyces sp. NPDC001985 TaxID=3154406 RepID=UPI00332458ED
MPRPAGAPLGVRLVRRLSSTRAFARTAPHVVPALDSAVHRLTGGRAMLSTLMLPGLVLTARGARTGLPRAIPLACLPREDGSWILIGSNFGRERHPAWTGNLLAHPEAEISWKGVDVAVRARLLEGEEREEVWERVLRLWPPYATYQARIPRQIRLFALTRSPSG